MSLKKCDKTEERLFGTQLAAIISNQSGDSRVHLSIKRFVTNAAGVLDKIPLLEISASLSSIAENPDWAHIGRN